MTGVVNVVVSLGMLVDLPLRHVVDAVPHLPIEWMAWTHGLANALGFALCAVLAWTRTTSGKRPDEAR